MFINEFLEKVQYSNPYSFENSNLKLTDLKDILFELSTDASNIIKNNEENSIYLFLSNEYNFSEYSKDDFNYFVLNEPKIKLTNQSLLLKIKSLDELSIINEYSYCRILTFLEYIKLNKKFFFK
jgi:hypothetical protein